MKAETSASARDIEKLQAIGFHIRTDLESIGSAVCFPNGVPISEDVNITERAGWQMAKTFVRTDVGMKVSMADKIRFLGGCDLWFIMGQWEADAHNSKEGFGDSPEAAVDCLFWLVE